VAEPSAPSVFLALLREPLMQSVGSADRLGLLEPDRLAFICAQLASVALDLVRLGDCPLHFDPILQRRS
jgi:hypothetical protein